MRFISAKPLVDHARKNGYAVPALNSNGGSYDIARAALEACQKTNSPLILQVYEPNCDYRGYDYFVNLADFLCNELKIEVPVALQVDHGRSFESVSKAIDSGFTSVMIDVSSQPLETNISETKKVIEYAGRRNVSVEAEVGYVKGNEPPERNMTGRAEIHQRPQVKAVKTSVDEAIYFVEKTKVDMLAVNIGTTHGCYNLQDDIDFDLLSELCRKVDIPLVQHGTCGIRKTFLEKLSKNGMSKINFGEFFRFNYINYFIELADSMEHFWHPWKIMQQVKKRLRSDMIELIEAVGSCGQADYIEI